MKSAYIQLLVTCLFLLSATMLLARKAFGTSKEDLDTVFHHTEIKPSFKGGIEALNQYLAQNMNVAPEDEGEQALAYFIVSGKGNIYQVKVLPENLYFEKSLAKALAKSSGMWNSAQQGEHPVNSYCTLKITYQDKKIEAVME